MPSLLRSAVSCISRCAREDVIHSEARYEVVGATAQDMRWVAELVAGDPSLGAGLFSGGFNFGGDGEEEEEEDEGAEPADVEVYSPCHTLSCMFPRQLASTHPLLDQLLNVCIVGNSWNVAGTRAVGLVLR